MKFFPLAKAIKSDIITAGRDDASARAFPLCLGKPPIDQRWMAALLFVFLSAAEGAPQLERPEHEREDIGEIPLGKGDKI